MLFERVAAFVRGESEEGFAELALAVFRAGYEADATYRELCERRGARPDGLSDWRRVPAMPVAAGSGRTPHEDGPGGREPRESPADGPGRAPGGKEPDGPPADGPPADDPAAGDLRRAVIDRSFPAACLAGLTRPPVLSLVPAGSGAETVADRVLEAWAAPDSAVALRPRGVEVARARSFLAARQRDRRPTLILATATSLSQLLESLARRGLRFRLPAGSRVVETGVRAPADRALLARLADCLDVPPEGLLREYAAGALPSRFYAGHAPDGEPRPFTPPPWTRVRILDPAGLDEEPPGSAGSIAVFDLAALDAAPCVLTAERGLVAGNGFRLA